MVTGEPVGRVIFVSFVSMFMGGTDGGGTKLSPGTTTASNCASVHLYMFGGSHVIVFSIDRGGARQWKTVSVLRPLISFLFLHT